MIKYLTRNKIDIDKYDACISNSINSRIYASSWYLDIITDDWDALIMDDYTFVMPLPRRKKYGLNYIYLPSWTQQLGVFSNSEIDEKIILNFLSKIPKKYLLVDCFLNSGNKFSSENVIKRINYILPLNTDFKSIKKSYNKNRKRISNKEFGDFRIEKNGNIDAFLELYMNQELNFKTHKDSVEKLKKLVNSNNELVHIWNVFKDEEIIAGLVWLKSKNRITYLVPISSDKGKNENIPTFLVNELINEFQNSDYILDFEGSMVDGVAKFYKSFGAIKEEYYFFKQKRLF